MKKQIAMALGVLATSYVVPCRAARLQLSIDDIRSAKGQVLIAVYKEASAFPKKPEAAIVKKAVPAKEGHLKVEIEDLEPGAYAIALHHDENSDNQMGFSFIGMPKEGFGFSGNKRIYFGPPSFKNAQFEVAGPSSDIEIRMKYF